MSYTLLQRWRLWVDLGLQAWLSLSDHRLRTALSVMGIAIGISAVILIGVVSEGGKQKVFTELQTFGLRTTWVMRDYESANPNRTVREGTGINNANLKDIKQSSCCSGVIRISPWVYPPEIDDSSRVRVKGRYAQSVLEGVGHEHLLVNNDELIAGRNFTEREIEAGSHVAILGDEIRSELFPDDSNPIGEELRIGSSRYVVIGILRRKDRTFMSSIGSGTGMGNANKRLMIPYKRVQAMLGNDQINILQVELAPSGTSDATEQLINFLRRIRKGDFKYRVEGMSTYVDTARNIMNGVSVIGVVAAAVSLVVAGIGILNIMSTSVIERTREIGLRKAVGGTSHEILLQFMFEACLVSLAGGALGLMMGGGFSIVITKLTGFPLLPSVPLIAISLLASLIVGLAAGILPAWRAAQLRPVEALRYE